MAGWFFAAGPYNVTCGDIGNCSAKTPTVDVAFTNITHGLLFVIGSLAVIFVIVSGLQMAASVGNARRYQQARESLLYSVIGLALAIVAYGIVTFVANAF